MCKPANFSKVDSRVWRGARPDLDQANWLGSEGVNTVLNLEWEHGDDAAFDERLTPIKLIRIRDFEPLPWFAPSIADEHVIHALAAIRQGPPIVYVHCRSGQNRTGVIVAAYRILERGDSPDVVTADFQKYRGFWAQADAIYIQSIYRRRSDLLQRITGIAAIGPT